MVDEHPFRSDPSHILTHRVQAGTTGFVAALLKTLPKPSEEHALLHTLRTLNKAVSENLARGIYSIQWCVKVKCLTFMIVMAGSTRDRVEANHGSSNY